jgi:hypothetical protein
MRVIAFATIALAVVISAPFAWGQNLAVNGDFDTDVTGWFPATTAAIDWTSLDADANPASGSALVTNLSTTAGDATGASQCIEGLTGEAFYLFAAEMLVPGGQSETGHAFLFVQWNDEAGCSGYLGSAFSSQVQSSTPNVWYGVSEIVQAPLGTESARLRLSVLKHEDVGALQTHFDNVVFEELIFIDGFESGDTSAWSTTVP